MGGREQNAKKKNAEKHHKAPVILHIYHNCRCQTIYQTMLKYLIISVFLSICCKFLLHYNSLSFSPCHLLCFSNVVKLKRTRRPTSYYYYYYSVCHQPHHHFHYLLFTAHIANRHTHTTNQTCKHM